MDKSYVLVEGVGEDETPRSGHTTLQLRGREREQEVMPFGHTRVMSPNYCPTTPNQSLLLGIECRCTMCGMMTPDPVMCAQCGIYGHPICLGVQQFQNHMFCVKCTTIVTSQFSAINDAITRQQWQAALSNQLVVWKSRAVEAIGVSASIGVTVGGVAVTAAGAAVAVAQGIVQGAASASSGGGNLSLRDEPIPPPPTPDSSFHRPKTLRRSNSEGDLGAEEFCQKCATGKRTPHTYRGNCIGLPPSVYFPKKAESQRITSSEQIFPLRPEDSAISTELDSRRMVPTLSLPVPTEPTRREGSRASDERSTSIGMAIQVESAADGSITPTEPWDDPVVEEECRRHAHTARNERLRRDLEASEAEMRTWVGRSPEDAVNELLEEQRRARVTPLKPPSSFDSATSNARQSWYGGAGAVEGPSSPCQGQATLSELPPRQSDQATLSELPPRQSDQIVPSDVTTRRGDPKPPVYSVGATDASILSEVLVQLRALVASHEEMQRAVRDLQSSYVRLEDRVSNLEAQWEHQEIVGPET